MVLILLTAVVIRQPLGENLTLFSVLLAENDLPIPPVCPTVLLRKKRAPRGRGLHCQNREESRKLQLSWKLVYNCCLPNHTSAFTACKSTSETISLAES